MTGTDVVIVAARRTPMGGLLGALCPLSGPELGSRALSAALAQAGLSAETIDQVFMGTVLPAGVGQAPARQAALGAGFSFGTGCTTINKVCGSGMQAVILACDQLRAGSHAVIAAGGMESMSNAPYLLADARRGLRLGHGTVKDHMFLDGLEDAETGRLMGDFAQETADARGLTREAMDDFALTSLSRARTAMDAGLLTPEITPVTVETRKGATEVVEDEQPRTAVPERIPQLRPAFGKNGTITAANASSISDGAAALVLMTADAAQRFGCTPLARIVAHENHARHPAEFTIAPAGAIEKVLARAAWQVDDVDAFEINEAFAMVTMLAIEDLELATERVNVFGGACAQGHPIGCTGARLIVTLLNVLTQRGGRRGVAALCIGGGEATAVAIERLT